MIKRFQIEITATCTINTKKKEAILLPLMRELAMKFNGRRIVGNIEEIIIGQNKMVSYFKPNKKAPCEVFNYKKINCKPQNCPFEAKCMEKRIKKTVR